MFGALKAGGILMLPIILCGIFATFIIVERCYYFYVTKKRDIKLMFDLKNSISKADYVAAENACSEADTPTAQVVKKALDCRAWPEKDLKETVEAEMSAVIPRYEHFLTPLGTIANISTLLGLLGTVTGNIKAFGVLGAGDWRSSCDNSGRACGFNSSIDFLQLFCKPGESPRFRDGIKRNKYCYKTFRKS